MRARLTLATCIAVACATTLGLAQATPSGQQRQTGQRENERTVTVVGCLQQEKDVHGQQPNVAERAGVGDDFILTQTTMKPGTNGSAAAGSTATGGNSASGSAGTAGSHAMYKIKGLDEEKLRPLISKRVEVMGKIEQESSRARGAVETGNTGPTGSGTSGTGTTATGRRGTTGTGGTTSGARETDSHDMPELRATSIKEVAGACQSTQ